MTKMEEMTLTNHGEGWEKKLKETNINKMIIQYCQSNHKPALWGDIDHFKIDSDYFNYISDVNIKDIPLSLTIPIHSSIVRFCTISFSLNKTSDYNQNHFLYASSLVQAIIPYLQEKINKIVILNQTEFKKLTKREAESLTWATEGKSAWEISKILGCSERTATFHLQNVCSKLGASNKYQAISKGILSGTIIPSTYK